MNDADDMDITVSDEEEFGRKMGEPSGYFNGESSQRLLNDTNFRSKLHNRLFDKLATKMRIKMI
jgi:hypothetical protein